jgi:Tol biopolymer transport system component/DNA-binding winged helix-turn-helix (wHTH) protein
MLKNPQIPADGAAGDTLASEGFLLGSCRVEPRALRVTRDGDSVRLEPRMMQVLLALARRDGRTVSREELLAEAWNGAVITDDSIYRVIHRLRSVLSADARTDAVIETVPKVGYRLLQPVRPLAAGREANAASAAPPSRSRLPLIIAAVAATAIGTAAWLSSRTAAPPPPAWMTLTMNPGLEHMPAFSPDGSQLLYSRGAAGREQLWLRSLDGSADMALTAPENAMDYAADWSAGGERIAFLRQDEQRCRVMIMTLLQREPRAIGECTPANGRLSLSPDGRTVVLSDRPDPDQRVNALFLIDVDSGVRRSLPTPPAEQGDYRPRFSPDGDWIAFSRVDGRFQSSVLRVRSDGSGLEPVWTPSGFVHQLQWRNAHELIVTRRLGASSELWQVPLHGTPAVIAAIDDGVPSIDISPDGTRLLLSVAVTHYRNRRLALERHAAGAVQAMPAALDRARDLAVSPDGRRVALPWEARGESGVWLADIDGGQLRRLWSESGTHIRDLSWDPSGQRIAFERSRGNRQTICVVDLNGLLQCLPDQPRKRISPSWSNDGRRLLFVQEDEGGWFAHRAALDGSGEDQLGRRQSMYAVQAPDGDIVYLRPRGSDGIVALDTVSGEEHLLVDDAPHSRPRALVAARSGLYYLRADGMLMHRRLASGMATALAPLGTPLPRTLSLSAAEDLLLYSEVAGEEADIALLTNLDALVGTR